MPLLNQRPWGQLLRAGAPRGLLACSDRMSIGDDSIDPEALLGSSGMPACPIAHARFSSDPGRLQVRGLKVLDKGAGTI